MSLDSDHNIGYMQDSYFPHRLNLPKLTPKGRRGGLLQGSLMRLVSLWWELPPRLDSNISISPDGMQQFFVEYG